MFHFHFFIIPDKIKKCQQIFVFVRVRVCVCACVRVCVCACVRVKYNKFLLSNYAEIYSYSSSNILYPYAVK